MKDEHIANEIIRKLDSDISDRGGLKHEWKAIDDDIMDDLKKTWCEIITSTMAENNSLPTVREAGIIAVDIADGLKDPLTVQEQAFFIAGFQECIKYLMSKEKGE